MIIYNIINHDTDRGCNIHSSYKSLEDAKTILKHLYKIRDYSCVLSESERSICETAYNGGFIIYSIEESCLHDSSEIKDLIKI